MIIPTIYDQREAHRRVARIAGAWLFDSHDGWPQRHMMTAAASSSDATTRPPMADRARRSPSLEVPGLVPLIIGATGHRGLRDQDIPALQDRVRAFFRELRVTCPRTPFVVLSSLAEGADRLVARLALDEFDATLVVPLPLEPSDYEADFGDGAARDDFRTLLRRATRAFVVDAPPSQSAGATVERVDRYRRAGAYVARNSHLLIALWDGVRSERAGGTWEVVQFQVEGVPPDLDPAHSPLDLPECGPVYHVLAPRAGDDRSLAITSEWLLPAVSTDSAEAIKVFERIYKTIDEYNVDVSTVEHSQSRLEQTKKGLIPECEWASLAPGLEEILERYALADGLALYFQRRMYRVLNLLLGAAFGVTVLLQSHILLRQLFPIARNAVNPAYAKALFRVGASSDVWLAPYDIPYLLALAAVVALYGWSSRRGDQKRYQDYRAVAEGLRVQFYWRFAGLPNSAADYYLRKQKGELDWIRGALRVVDIVRGPCNPVDQPGAAIARLRLVTTHWVDDQMLFFVGKARSEGIRSRNAHVSRRLFGWLDGPDFSDHFIGRAAARKEDWKGRKAEQLKQILLLFVFPAFGVTRSFVSITHPFVMGLVLLSAFLVLLGVYARVRSFSDHAKQYGRMGITFANARKHLERLLDRDTRLEEYRVAAAQLLLRDLGAEALAENGDWVLLHRERPLELPRV